MLSTFLVFQGAGCAIKEQINPFVHNTPFFYRLKTGNVTVLCFHVVEKRVHWEQMS